MENSHSNSTNEFNSLLKEIGLFEYYPQKLQIRDAITIRDDTLNIESIPNSSILYPFIVLQKVMAFDSNCRIPFQKCTAELDSSDNFIHPMDGLLALIHCCDDFLRQDLFSRMATCQIAVPLLLPDPCTGKLKMLLWAMRTIVKEFKLQDEMEGEKAYCCRIVDHPMPFVSFLRVGCHKISKSEIINDVMSNSDSDNRNQPFFGYNFDGGDSRKLLFNGVVEVSWYLPGDKFIS